MNSMGAAAAGNFSTALHSTVPHFAKDAHELRSVVAAQAAEAEALKQRLAHGQRECARLAQHLRDTEGELHVASEATTSATERLGSHAERHGLVLAASVERSGAERGTVEHELQRVEALLHERDLEIRRLRKHAHELEAASHQHGMEIKGLRVLHEGTTHRAREAADGVSSLREQLQGQPASLQSLRGPSQREVQRTEETAALLAARQHDHAVLKQRAEAAAHEAKRLEAEEQALTERITAFQRELQAKKDQMESHDQRFLQEGQLLREHCDQLRAHLHQHQIVSVEKDQRAVLHPQAGAEAESVRREMQGLLETVPRLAHTLKARGQRVRSPQQLEDSVDAKLHGYLRGLDEAGVDTPAMVWRLCHKMYLLGDERVELSEQDGQLVVASLRGGGRITSLANVLRAPGGYASQVAQPLAQTVNC